MRRSLLIAAASAIASASLFVGQPAECQHCVPTFCGFTSECPGDCVCAIPNDQATGTCVGTR